MKDELEEEELGLNELDDFSDPGPAFSPSLLIPSVIGHAICDGKNYGLIGFILSMPEESPKLSIFLGESYFFNLVD